MTTINILKLHAELKALIKQLPDEADRLECLAELQPGSETANDPEFLQGLLEHVNAKLAHEEESEEGSKKQRRHFESKFNSAAELNLYLNEVIFPLMNTYVRMIKTDKMGGDAFIIINDEWITGEQKFVIYHKADDIRNRFASIGIPAYVFYKDGDKGTSAPINTLKKWQQTPLAQDLRLNGLTYHPGFPTFTDRKFNTYKDVSVLADPDADCSVFIEHVENNICNGNKEYSEYFLSYLAHMVQHPDERPFASFTISGDEGTGKGICVDFIVKMMGGSRNCNTTAGPEDIKKFNTAVGERLFLLFDEAIFSGSHEQISFMKKLVTEPRIRIEPKGIDAYEVPNFARAGITTNNMTSGSPATIGSRRDFTIECRNGIPQPELKALATKLGLNKPDETTIPNCVNGFKHFLETRDLTNFDSQALPMMTTGIDGKIHNTYKTRPIQAQLVEWLNAPDLTLYVTRINRRDGIESDDETGVAWGDDVSFAEFYKAFSDNCKDAHSRAPSKIMVSKELKNYGIEVIPGYGNARMLELPPPRQVLARLREKSRFDTLVTPEQEEYINAYTGGVDRSPRGENVLELKLKKKFGEEA